MAIIWMFFQKSGPSLFGTRNVQLPPRTFRLSSHTGRTVFLKRWTESRRTREPSGKLLNVSQKVWTLLMSINLTKPVPYTGPPDDGEVVLSVAGTCVG